MTLDERVDKMAQHLNKLYKEGNHAEFRRMGDEIEKKLTGDEVVYLCAIFKVIGV